MSDFYYKGGQIGERANSAAYVVGDKVVIARADTSTNYAVVRKWVLECTTAGTSGAAVPAWPATVTQDTTTVTDGTTLVWTFRKPGYSSGTTAGWTFASPFFDYISTAMAAGDRLFCSSSGTETQSGAITATFPGTCATPCQVLSVSDTAAPPTTLAAGATITSSGNSVTLNGIASSAGLYVYGLTLNSYNTMALASNGNGGTAEFKGCTFNITATSVSTYLIQIGTIGASSDGQVVCKSCAFSFASTDLGIAAGTANVAFENCSVSGSIYLMKYIGSGGRGGGNVRFSGCDLSGLGASANLVNAGSLFGGSFVIRNSRLPAAWSGSLVTGTFDGFGFRAAMHNCDTGATNYRIAVQTYAGTILSETTIVRTGGASDGTTALSWKMASTTNAEYPLVPLESDEIVIWNDVTGTSQTATVEIVHDSQGAGTSGAFQNDEIWLELQYPGSATTPQSSFASDSKADVFATTADHPTSTATWTTTGLTTPVKQKLSVPFTAQQKGFLIAKVKMAKASKTVYIDPKLTVA